MHDNRIASVGPLKPVFPPFRRKCPVPAASGQHLVANRDRGLIVVQVVPVLHLCGFVRRVVIPGPALDLGLRSVP